MKQEPTHLYFGTPLREWMQKVPNELDRDAIGLWQIIPALQESFGLTGDYLEDSAKAILDDILSRGAWPVKGFRENGGFWKKDDKYGNTKSDIINSVLEEWRAMGRDPDVGDVWFALPKFFIV